MDNKQITGYVKNLSRELGFAECGILPACFLAEEQVHLQTWLDSCMQGTMSYMARNMEKRLDPRKLVENAKTVIVVVQNFYTPVRQADFEAPLLSKYALGKDYHQVMKSKLRQLLQYLCENIPGCTGRIFVDSAPVLERAWARRAGLGWIGKNSNLISRKLGSYLFIGEIILDAELLYDNPVESPDHCGNCTRCMEACPTKAILAPRIVDARRCISYQTIENKTGPDEIFRGSLQNRVFGCDICQEVCPWNRGIAEHQENEFIPSSALLELSAKEWTEMDETRFSELFRDSPVMRAGYSKLMKNVEMVMNASPKQK